MSTWPFKLMDTDSYPVPTGYVSNLNLIRTKLELGTYKVCTWYRSSSNWIRGQLELDTTNVISFSNQKCWTHKACPIVFIVFKLIICCHGARAHALRKRRPHRWISGSLSLTCWGRRWMARLGLTRKPGLHWLAATLNVVDGDMLICKACRPSAHRNSHSQRVSLRRPPGLASGGALSD